VILKKKMNDEQYEIEESIDTFINRFKPRSVNDLDQDELNYYYDKGYDDNDIKSKFISTTVKRDLKTHRPLEYYFNKSKINYNILPREVDKKLWHLKMDPLFKNLPNDGPWISFGFGRRCELCLVDPHHRITKDDYLQMCCSNNNRYLCYYHIKYLLKFNRNKK
jgi:hypothetical protein